MTFEEFSKNYTIYEGPRYKVKSDWMTTWYIKSKDFKNGLGYYAYAGSKNTAIWTLRQTYECLLARGEL